MRRIRIEALNK